MANLPMASLPRHLRSGVRCDQQVRAFVELNNRDLDPDFRHAQNLAIDQSRRGPRIVVLNPAHHHETDTGILQHHVTADGWDCVVFAEFFNPVGVTGGFAEHLEYHHYVRHDSIAFQAAATCQKRIRISNNVRNGCDTSIPPHRPQIGAIQSHTQSEINIPCDPTVIQVLILHRDGPEAIKLISPLLGRSPVQEFLARHVRHMPCRAHDQKLTTPQRSLSRIAVAGDPREQTAGPAVHASATKPPSVTLYPGTTPPPAHASRTSNHLSPSYAGSAAPAPASASGGQ